MSSTGTDIKREGCGLLLWKNPVETGKVFGGLLVGLLIVKKVNLITFFLRVLYTVVFITGSLEFVTKLLLGQGLVSAYGPKECPNTVGILRPQIDKVLLKLPVLQAKMRKLMFAYQPKNNFKAAVVLFFLHKFFSWFSVWTIAFVGVIGAFTVPLVYSIFQTEIDSAVDSGIRVAKTKTGEFSSMASEKTKPYLESLDSKLGPVSKFVKSQYHQANTVTPQSTTSKMAAEVPLEPEQRSQGHSSSSAAFPAAPTTEPLGQETHEFSVDQLQSELKQSTEGLKHDLQQNNAAI
ncbi:hypothetical protein HG537_0G01810 [Torulaspora globosa]|uniref:Reticulon-like protein n=1 Tax=Torulaspora globosa TaxID=48254 RepID=A0A7H9HYK1_9SACH|nr:hypothetical protein HG537_0G01810 [Torulaspora sp. CBS 2947]